MTTPEQLETRMLRDRAAIRDEQLAQAQENALLLYQALAKHAPDALAEIKPRLHANIREMDKVVCEVTAAREEAARLRDILVELTDATAYGQPGGYIEFDPNFPERRYCTYCGESWGINSQEWHDADCPVARARALLSE